MTTQAHAPLNLPQGGDESLPTYRPIFDLTDEELRNFQVTPLSRYADIKWKRPITTPGTGASCGVIQWNMELFDGSRLDEPQHAQRLDWARKLMALLLHAPSDSIPPSPSTMAIYRIAFQRLLSWMAENGYHRPGEFTHEVIEHYIDDLPRFLLSNRDDDSDEEISISEVSVALKILPYLWSERHGLANWGIPVPQTNFFYGKRIHTYAKQIATKAMGWIKPLPDEVSIQLFNKAAWFLGEPAEDVIRLLDVVRDPLADSAYEEIRVPISARNKHGVRRLPIRKGESARLRRAESFLSSFKFSTVGGEDRPWHEPLDPEITRTIGRDGRKIKEVHVRVRELLNAVRDACAITVQGVSGIRISELMGIKAGIDAATGLPRGVRIEKSVTGLYDIYLLRTVIAKTKKGEPKETDWVLGIRPTGAPNEPLAVRALRVLNRLFEPWGENARTDRLFLALGSNRFLPLKTTSLADAESSAIREAMKSFITSWVDLSSLPDESAHKTEDNDLVKWREKKGDNFTSHMLRKSWAQFVFAVDPRLTPAIQMQFHHLSLAMSDVGYVGSNPNLGTTLKAVATHQRNLLIFETVMGRAPLAGKMGTQIEAQTRELAKEVKGLPTSDAWQRVIQFADKHELQIWFNPYGQCMPLQTSEMACHNRAGTPQVLRLAPNDATRSPTMCSGCDCWILDERHAHFWEKRYLENWIAFKRAEKMGMAGNFRVIKERASQAKKLLAKVGIKVTHLDRQIAQELEAEGVAA
ncbi:integrase [Betaproteobacteria bacterium SCN2]|jgi:integrase|nr:integrase [Betaproteobacteria bacterium SCN2]